MHLKPKPTTSKNDVVLSKSDCYDDGDFQIPLSQTRTQRPVELNKHKKKPLKPSNSQIENPKKKPKPSPIPSGRENLYSNVILPELNNYVEEEPESICGLDSIESSFDERQGHFCNFIESRFSKPEEGFQGGREIDALIKLCAKEGNAVNGDGNGGFRVSCPICGVDISGMEDEARLVHTNGCIDNEESRVVVSGHEKEPWVLPKVVDGLDRCLEKVFGVADVSPVLDWLRNLGLERYGDIFVREEVDWDTLQWLTEEDLLSMGVTALGPRKKIVHALNDLRKGCNLAIDSLKGSYGNSHSSGDVGLRSNQVIELQAEPEAFRVACEETTKQPSNKLITDYFQGPFNQSKKVGLVQREIQEVGKCQQDSVKKCAAKNPPKRGKSKDIPSWCSIPGTPFRVDAFKYIRADCSFWFLTHFHMDHYQGLTRSFCHGKIYCSSITAKLVHMKLGIPWDRLYVLPLNEKINIAGVDVTSLDANHCPGAIIILFEPLNGKAVLHTGDFRFCENMKSMAVLQSCLVHTLILDTTYCNPQFDFPKQEAVIQFVIEAIQVEAFNPKTLFLIGSYTIGKERLFLEVARVLRQKVHVTAAKFRLLECLGFSNDDMQWFTMNEQESNIHVVPMWTLASFKRLKHVSNQYTGRFSLIVAFSPTGWTFGKGKKKSAGRRWQQGTIIRYEVPYSEHCSFSELKEFVKFISPERILPSVNNDGADSANAMVSLLLS